MSDGWVWRSPVGEGTKLHVPTDDGVVTFVADEPREADAAMIAELQEKGYEFEQADVPEPPAPEQPTDKGAFDYDSADDATLRSMAGLDEDDETDRLTLIELVKEARGEA